MSWAASVKAVSIEAIAIYVSVIVAVVVFLAESRRSQRERRLEYRADVCAVVAERTAVLERDIDAMLDQDVASGARLWPLLREFTVALDGQLPRARVAGLDSAVNQLREVTSSFLERWSVAEGVNASRLRVRKETIAMLIDGGGSEQEATKAVDREPGIGNQWPDDQRALVQAFGNYLSTVRRAIQDHTGAGAFVPPVLGDWPKFASSNTAGIFKAAHPN
jgi:hypothetical protein